MASMRVGQKWLKRNKRTRLPRLDTIPRRTDADTSKDDADVEIVVDLSEEREASAPE